MTEFASDGSWQDASEQPSYIAEIIRGLGIPLEQTTGEGIGDIPVEDIGIPDRGMEDEDILRTLIPVTEQLYERVAEVADALGETPVEFVELAIQERLRRNANMEQRIGRVGRTEPGGLLNNDINAFERDS